jgi:hypothetical protein
MRTKLWMEYRKETGQRELPKRRLENYINLVRTFGMRLRTGLICLKIGPIGEVL